MLNEQSVQKQGPFLQKKKIYHFSSIVILQSPMLIFHPSFSLDKPVFQFTQDFEDHICF